MGKSCGVSLEIENVQTSHDLICTCSLLSQMEGFCGAPQFQFALCPTDCLSRGIRYTTDIQIEVLEELQSLESACSPTPSPTATPTPAAPSPSASTTRTTT